MAVVQGVSNEDNLLDEEIDALKAIFIDRISCSTNGSCVDVVYVNPDERLEIAFSIPGESFSMFVSTHWSAKSVHFRCGGRG